MKKNLLSLLFLFTVINIFGQTPTPTQPIETSPTAISDVVSTKP